MVGEQPGEQRAGRMMGGADSTQHCSTKTNAQCWEESIGCESEKALVTPSASTGLGLLPRWSSQPSLLPERVNSAHCRWTKESLGMNNQWTRAQER